MHAGRDIEKGIHYWRDCQTVKTIDRAKRAVANPKMFVRGANRAYHRRLGRRSWNTDGINHFSEDWDNLLILDACRFDMFSAQHDLPGTLERRTSRASSTHEFLQSNIHDRDLQDTVYVTSNPQLYKNRNHINDSFHQVIQVWQDEGWHDEFKTVLPETMNEYARKAEDDYPDKRLVVHYMQPHYPFIGEMGSRIFDIDTLALWDKVTTGEVRATDEDLWAATSENLDVVLPHVEELMRTLSGKTVVTSDHGQMIGERVSPFPIREYGHPRGIYTPELVEVPWLVYESGSRKKIVSEESKTTEAEVNDGIVEDRLQSLGYK